MKTLYLEFENSQFALTRNQFLPLTSTRKYVLCHIEIKLLVVNTWIRYTTPNSDLINT